MEVNKIYNENCLDTMARFVTLTFNSYNYFLPLVLTK